MEKDLEISKGSDFDFWKNIFFMVVFFTIAPITLVISLFSIYSLNNDVRSKPSQTSLSGIKIYASLPKEFPTISGETVSADARVELVKQYLQKYNSPLVKYAPILVEKADKYGVDFRLVTAIAQQESNLCKVIPENTYNCWGWGIHSRGTLGFNSYEEAIETVTSGIKKEYLDKGYNTPEEIMSKYTPLSDGSWAFGVSQFMDAME